MIDWVLTKIEYGRTDLSGKHPTVVVICDKCNSRGTKNVRRKRDIVDGQLSWFCAKCIANRPEKRLKSSFGAKKAWEDPTYRAAIVANSESIWQNEDLAKRMAVFSKSDKCKSMLRELAKREWTESDRNVARDRFKLLWCDIEYRQAWALAHTAAVQRFSATEEYRNKRSTITKHLWQDEAYKKLITDTTKANWQQPKFRDKWLQVFRSQDFRLKMRDISLTLWQDTDYASAVRLKQQKVSSIQLQLYSILDCLGVKYYRERNDDHDDLECKVGPWSMDCVIPRSGSTDLIVECQGNYWHSLPQQQAKDKAKLSYIQNNLSHKYELKYIWEHEFYEQNKVIDILKYWLNISKLDVVNFDFVDVNVAPCLASDANELLKNYHYLSTLGRGGICYGGWIDGTLISVAVFSPLPRQNISFIGAAPSDSRELSRFCIHPKYQKKNFASWFLSRCIKALPKKYSLIVAYSDSTFNHKGTIYSASNFVLDGFVRPDYWYVGLDGWVMHKRTLYGRAKSLKLTEKKFANDFGYTKVYGDEKSRYIYRR